MAWHGSLGEVGQGPARPGMVGPGLAWQSGCGWSRQGASWRVTAVWAWHGRAGHRRARMGAAGRGSPGSVRFGRDRLGWSWRGSQGRARRGTSSLGEARHGKSRCGRHGMSRERTARSGSAVGARRGIARLRRSRFGRHGRAGLGAASQGLVGQGSVRPVRDERQGAHVRKTCAPHNQSIRQPERYQQ
jgi:hypothetical protein